MKLAVMYTDGSSKDGISGHGIHGYYGEVVNHIQGSACPGQVHTVDGYMSRKEALAEHGDGDKYVTISEYIDKALYNESDATNNQAELSGIIDALRHICTVEVDEVVLYTDSQYCKRGLLEWVPLWEKNNWVKKDGEKVKNSDLWKDAIALVNTIEGNDITVDIRWIKGHAGHMGNVMADQLAGVAANNRRRQNDQIDTVTLVANQKEISEYWKPWLDRNPLLWCKFAVVSPMVRDDLYLLVDPIKSDIYDLGKGSPATGYGLVEMTVTDPVLSLMNSVVANAETHHYLCYVNMLRAYNKMHTRDLKRFGEQTFIRPRTERLDFKLIGSPELVLEEIRPTGLAFKSLEIYRELENVLLVFNEHGPITDGEYRDITFKDVTEEIFPVINNKPVLLQTLVVGKKTVTLSSPLEGKRCKYVLGKDLPTRNALNKMTKLNTSVYVVSWAMGDYIRYCTLVKNNDGIGVYSLWFNNIITI